jgi:hypothetical protein
VGKAGVQSSLLAITRSLLLRSDTIRLALGPFAATTLMARLLSLRLLQLASGMLAGVVRASRLLLLLVSGLSVALRLL